MAESFLEKWTAVINAMDIGRPQFVRHRARGSEYEVVGQAYLQTSKPLADMEPMVVYTDILGRMWVRPESEFTDGRFDLVESEESRSR